VISEMPLPTRREVVEDGYLVDRVGRQESTDEMTADEPGAADDEPNSTYRTRVH
jgi:hypothetical protein